MESEMLCRHADWRDWHPQPRSWSLVAAPSSQEYAYNVWVDLTWWQIHNSQKYPTYWSCFHWEKHSQRLLAPLIACRIVDWCFEACCAWYRFEIEHEQNHHCSCWMMNVLVQQLADNSIGYGDMQTRDDPSSKVVLVVSWDSCRRKDTSNMYQKVQWELDQMNYGIADWGITDQLQWRPDMRNI